MEVNQFAVNIALSALLNQFCSESYITLVGSGVHGIGKTRAAKVAAQLLGGVVETVDASVLGEKELTGYLVKKPTGRIIFNQEGYDKTIKLIEEQHLSISDEKKIDIIKDFMEPETQAGYNLHESLENIQRDQEYYYNILKTTGFKLRDGGTYLLEDDTELVRYENGTTKIIKKYNSAELRRKEAFNPFGFGENLEPSDRIYLMTSGQIQPIIYFIDEINKDQIILTETMNILLARSVHGYKIPWFVTCCGAMNPGGSNSNYAVRDLDPAQLDRLFYMQVEPQLETFSDWAIRTRHLPSEFITAVGILGAERANPAINEVEDNAIVQPSNRSLELAGLIYQHFDEVIESGIFSKAIQEHATEYFEELMRAILGNEYTGSMMTVLKDTSKYVRIEEVLTGTSPEISERVTEKFQKKEITLLAQKNLVSGYYSWCSENIHRVIELAKSPKHEDQITYLNFCNQSKKFISMLDPAIKTYFIDSLFVNIRYFNLKQLNGSYKEEVLFTLLGSFLPVSIAQEYKALLNDKLD